MKRKCPTCGKGELATTTSAPMPVAAVYSCGHAFGPGTEPTPLEVENEGGEGERIPIREHL
jgi:hypothetical protein